MSYQEAVSYLNSFIDLDQGPSTTPASQAMSVERTRLLLAGLGQPQHGRGTVHVTGSKGKGSTSTMIASMLDAEVGPTSLFTSPHIQKYTERMVLSGRQASEEDFARAVFEIKPYLDAHHRGPHGPVSFFQSLIALFFQLTRTAPDPIAFQVVEVGMGGLNDATNIFDRKDIAVFTPVSMEHPGVLGSTIAEIAENKAGIILPGCRVVIGPQRSPEAAPAIIRKARELGCPHVDVAREYRGKLLEVKDGKQSFIIEGPSGRDTYTSTLLGEHQVLNAMTALAAMESLEIALGRKFDRQTLIRGIDRAWLPGRLELLSSKPLILADGAHNDESAEVLWAALERLYPGRRAVIVLAANKDKNVRAIVDKLGPDTGRTIIATRTQNCKAMEACDLVDQAGLAPGTTVTATVEEALETAMTIAGEDDLILVTGSLYAAGEARDFAEKRARHFDPRLAVTQAV